jgi:hypothetical protein
VQGERRQERPGAGMAELFNWIQAEGNMLREVLNGGVQALQIRVISPYRVVAENSREIFLRVFSRRRSSATGYDHRG